MTEITPEQKLKLLIQHRPWEDEPDSSEWVDENTGYRCRIWRHPTHGQLNGYVGVFKGHPAYEKSNEYMESMMDVHGGLTYIDTTSDGVRWFGFDCNHHNDFAPKLVMTIMQYSSMSDAEFELKRRGTYKDWTFVENEVMSLVRQLNAMEKEELK